MLSIQPPIIVLGMHRSGTSLLTGSLQAAGLYLGDVNDWAKHNKKGNKENEPIRDLHERIFERHGLSWKQPREVSISWSKDEKDQLLKLVAPYCDIDKRWGIKDPRLVWLFDDWLEIFPNAQFIAIFRHPVLVASSLAARPGALKLSMQEGFKLWHDTNQRILELKERLDFPLLHFSEPKEMEATFFNPLSDFCASVGLECEASSFYDLSLINQSDPKVQMPIDVAELYERLIAARMK